VLLKFVRLYFHTFVCSSELVHTRVCVLLEGVSENVRMFYSLQLVSCTAPLNSLLELRQHQPVHGKRAHATSTSKRSEVLVNLRCVMFCASISVYPYTHALLGPKRDGWNMI
jgi:hypothetical protein